MLFANNHWQLLRTLLIKASYMVHFLAGSLDAYTFIVPRSPLENPCNISQCIILSMKDLVSSTNLAHLDASILATSLQPTI